MRTKEKIIEALGCAIDDLSEDRLIDVLLDAYKSKEQQIKKLEGANAQEREDLHNERERLREELRRMRSDPLYCASGEYYFDCGGRLFGIRVHGFKIEMYERKGNTDHMAIQLTPSEWTRR